jgi:hypothetical protein
MWQQRKPRLVGSPPVAAAAFRRLGFDDGKGGRRHCHLAHVDVEALVVDVGGLTGRLDDDGGGVFRRSLEDVSHPHQGAGECPGGEARTLADAASDLRGFLRCGPEGFQVVVAHWLKGIAVPVVVRFGAPGNLMPESDVQLR